MRVKGTLVPFNLCSQLVVGMERALTALNDGPQAHLCLAPVPALFTTGGSCTNKCPLGQQCSAGICTCSSPTQCPTGPKGAAQICTTDGLCKCTNSIQCPDEKPICMIEAGQSLGQCQNCGDLDIDVLTALNDPCAQRASDLRGE